MHHVKFTKPSTSRDHYVMFQSLIRFYNTIYDYKLFFLKKIFLKVWLLSDQSFRQEADPLLPSF